MFTFTCPACTRQQSVTLETGAGLVKFPCPSCSEELWIRQLEDGSTSGNVRKLWRGPSSFVEGLFLPSKLYDDQFVAEEDKDKSQQFKAYADQWAREFPPNSVVQLVSGGPKMTVVHVLCWFNSVEVKCLFFDRHGKRREEKFQPQQLKRLS